MIPLHVVSGAGNGEVVAALIEAAADVSELRVVFVDFGVVSKSFSGILEHF